jgi:hypothetical protein
MDIYEKARKAVKEALTGKWEYVYEVFNTFLEGDMKHFARVPGLAEWDEIFEPVAKTTVFAMSMIPLAVDSSVYAPLTDDVAFYDVAEGLMAAYTFGRSDVNFMPRARLMQEKTGRRISLRRVRQFLEDLGIFRNFRGGVIMTGIGQMLAKALIYGTANRTSTVVESAYLGALIANTLLTEMKRFNEESVRMFLLETIARYKRISSTVREWQRNAPKLYLRDVPIHYNWEDAIKDAALMLADKKEDFRFTI